MTSHCFNKLDPEMQLDLVMTHGIALGCTGKYNLLLRLFQFEHFYVELFCRVDTEELVTIRAFTDTDSLEPYLETIDISSLV